MKQLVRLFSAFFFFKGNNRSGHQVYVFLFFNFIVFVFSGEIEAIPLSVAQGPQLRLDTAARRLRRRDAAHGAEAEGDRGATLRWFYAYEARCPGRREGEEGFCLGFALGRFFCFFSLFMGGGGGEFGVIFCGWVIFVFGMGGGFEVCQMCLDVERRQIFVWHVVWWHFGGFNFGSFPVVSSLFRVIYIENIFVSIVTCCLVVCNFLLWSITNRFVVDNDRKMVGFGRVVETLCKWW